MNKKFFISIFIGFFFVSILGSLSHFFYEWSHENRLVALFCPVNESTWEHMKLLFFPMLLYTIFITYYFPNNNAILTAMLFGNLFGTISIPVFFYTYSGILGYHITFIDIAIFYISVFYAFYKTCFFFCCGNALHSFTSALWQSFLYGKKPAQKTSSALVNTLFGFVHRFFSSLHSILCQENIAVGITFLFIILFFVFTFYPPDIALFKNPV